MLGFEPRTFSMRSRHSTTELHPHRSKKLELEHINGKFMSYVIWKRVGQLSLSFLDSFADKFRLVIKKLYSFRLFINKFTALDLEKQA